MKAALSFTLCLVCAAAACRRSPQVDTQEAAYRANNRGVALLEQFAYPQAADAFREALRLNPTQRLARINLPIALFYAGMNKEAAEQAAAANRAYPDAPQPLFIMGLAARTDNRTDEAVDAFRRVLQLDADDVGSKVNLALIAMQQRQYEEAVQFSQSALAIEPFNATAAYNLSLALTRTGRTAEGAQTMQRFEAIRAAGASITYSQTYLEQGRYAEAIASTGAEPDLAKATVPSLRFVDATSMMIDSGVRPVADSNSPAEPLTSSITLADVDKDGSLDVLATGPKGVRLLKNERAHLVDITSATGLGPAAGPARGAVVGDFNNDQKPDVLILADDGPRLFAQVEKAAFREVNIRSVIPTRQIAHAAAFVDVDHDGDLDILLGGFVEWSGSGSIGWELLRTGRPTTTRLLRNNGNGTFLDVTGEARLDDVARVVALAPTDFDNRRDIDLLMVSHGSRPKLFRNLRTGSFADVAADVGFPEAGPFTTLATADINKDGFTDAFFGRESAEGIWALSDGRGRFKLENAPQASKAAIAAQISDYDNDGLLDLIVLTIDGPRLFRNTGATWQDETDRAFAPEVRESARSGNVVAMAVGDLDLDGDSDVVVLLRTGDVRIWRNDGGNQNHSLRVTLAGRVSNRDGVGAKVEVRAGSLHQKVETSSTSPPTAPADIVFGLGRRSETDAVRIIWPAGIVQSETPAGSSGSLTVVELNRKPSSCPFLFAWNGSRFEFVTDFLGGGEMGSWEGPNLRNTPHPLEHVRITDQQLKMREGRFEIRVTNELEEALFLDQLELLAITHPSDVQVFPDEGLRERLKPYHLYTTRAVRPPAAARDDHGHDVLTAIARLDRRYPDDFPLLPIRGHASAHALVLNLGIGPGEPAGPVVLLLTGWTDYAFSSDKVAASQAGLTLEPPILQAKTSSGRWETVDADIGIPIGRPQTLVVDVTRFSRRELRILTSMRIYWDQIQVADATEVPVRTQSMPLGSASLHWRGFSAEVTPDGLEPFGYDYHHVLFESPWKVMPGRYTREGDVLELLSSADDRFVISRSGDEIVLSFDGSSLGPLASGERRTFLLRSVGYSKEMNLHSASPDVVAPLPFRAMSRYPYTPTEHYPHMTDLDRFHTRVVTRSLPTLDRAASSAAREAAGAERR